MNNKIHSTDFYPTSLSEKSLILLMLIFQNSAGFKHQPKSQTPAYWQLTLGLNGKYIPLGLFFHTQTWSW